MQINDDLPQVMCTDCIAFINESKQFRRRCEDAQKFLSANKLDLKLEQLQLVKTECERSTQIHIDEFPPNDDDFKDYDDNIALNTLQDNHVSPDGLADDKEKQVPIEFEPSSVDNLDSSNTLNGRKCKKTNVKMKPERIKAKSEKESKKVQRREKKATERVKEEIECEYCHKILTSKLSLRNHYKIHTGFDVVCEVMYELQ